MTAIAANPVVRYHHSGGFGDLIYGLPVLDALSRIQTIDLEISVQAWAAEKPGEFSRPIMQHDFAVIAPLLRGLPYLHSVEWREQKSAGVNDLDAWRRKHYCGNIAYSHLKMLRANGDPLAALKKPWIAVDPIFAAPIVISRSIRWQEPGSNQIWRRIVDAAGPHCSFIGTWQDYTDFNAAFGHISFCPTRDLLEAARVIAGSNFYIGNQSACLALAQGMHHPAIAYERYRAIDNCDIAEIPTTKFDEAGRMEEFLASLKM